jgi:hypothetical protein
MNKTFRWCVELLEYLAAKLHITYEAINIWIFVIIQPIIFFIMLYIIYRQHAVIKTLKHQLLP